jgi:5-methylcytosine-specific restriction endonuclease McrA
MSKSHRAYGDTRTTDQRGLGWDHQQDRARKIAAMVEGTPCPNCGLPMSKAQALELDHVIPRAMGGTDGVTRLTHAKCNRSSGATLGNNLRKRGKRRRPQRQKPRYPKW